MLCYNINVASYSGFNYYPISFGWGGNGGHTSGIRWKTGFQFVRGLATRVQYFFRWSMQFIRNSPMHKINDLSESVAKQYNCLIDILLLILDHAAQIDDE